MKRAARWILGAAIASGALLGTAALSRTPYAPAGPGQSLVRLSWRARGERVEACRRLSAEEIAGLPIHMRRTEVCEGRVLPYHLTVELDGRSVLRETIRPAGAREDRPLYVFAELPITPGEHRLAVRFIREPIPRRVEKDDDDRDDHDDEDDDHDEDDEGDDDRESDGRGDDRERRRPSAGETPARLELVRTLNIRAGEVTLVTYDADLRTLITLAPGP